MNVGILGIGVYLPEEVRTNDWWPKEIVEGWRARRLARMTHAGPPEGVELTEGVRRVLAAMERYDADPFQGGERRHVMSENETSTDMEVEAARRALEASGTGAEEIDFVLSQSTCPDYVAVNNAAAIQQQLRLRRDVFSLETQGACNGFLLQLHLSESLVRSGRARRGLVIQSSPLSRLMDPREPFSTWFGDGASAAVVGEVPAGYGILAIAQRTDGSTRRALLGTAMGGQPWFGAGEVRIRALEPLLGRSMLLRSADMGREVIDEALAAAEVTRDEVAFYAGHQANRWFREVTQAHAGLDRSRFLDTYQWTGNLAGAGLPVVLANAQQAKQLRHGDNLVLYAGGGGMTWSGAVVRWSC